ncbi:hypothetical protein HNS38_05080 [Lentimicrobium sp. L6]|nr:hypothetical protein [Lentimicrobium sp. L6]NPD46916.1 hypothetical protein [Lentimicrobium sp. S6]NPD84120.1 hypothetical protein [Lentimicrobium sp. L6]
MLLLLAVVFMSFSCSIKNKKSSEEDLIKAYYQALNSGDFNRISCLLSDSLITMEMDFVLTKGIQGFHEQFQWDSVFNAKHKLMEIQNHKDSIFTIQSKIGKRIDFLQDSAVICKVWFEFDKNKISKIHTLEYIYFNIEKWEPRRDSLVAWVGRVYPGLNGFIYDLSPKGAKNYLKAIKLYEKRQ